MMEFIDLKTQRRKLAHRLEERMGRVLDHGKFIMGPEVQELEEELAKFVGVKHAITCANGTDALQLVMMALGIGPGDEVITTSFSFFATVETILLLGAKPVFVDIDPRTYNLNPANLKSAITPKTKLILPVSLYGQCFDFEAVNAIAREAGIPVIEDAAQSFGALSKGKRSCSQTTMACTSFFPSKPLGCYGDGGACFTNDDQWAKRLKQIRVHGQEGRYHHAYLGVNSRLDTLQAAILLAKMEIFPAEIDARQRVAKIYNELFRGVLETPVIAPENLSVFAQYTIEVDRRDEFQKKMEEMQIPTMVHYPSPMHKQPAFQKLFTELKPQPFSEKAAQRVVSLPFHPYMVEQDQVRVVEAVKKALGK